MKLMHHIKTTQKKLLKGISSSFKVLGTATVYKGQPSAAFERGLQLS